LPCFSLITTSNLSISTNNLAADLLAYNTSKQMTMEVALELEYSGESPQLESNLNDEEDQIEQLLSDKLMQGYTLLEKSCPSCATPLVKKEAAVEDKSDPTANKAVEIPVLVSSQSFDQPFRPVPGVPFCVACQSHVVTEESEISILERCDSLKHKGSILVALKGDSFSDDGASQPESKKDLPLLEENGPSMVEHDSPASPQYEEKKEEEPSAVTPTGMVMDNEHDADDIMAEYSVR
jgi:hypothetical protein